MRSPTGKSERDTSAAGISDARWRRAVRRCLRRWYARHARALPWRESRDPYRIWVSEIMLQQTQVSTVGPYFSRFVAAFPTVSALASASAHDVLRLWEGLGYYRRARQMHDAARQVVADFGGLFPRDARTLGSLPGIGRYTAGAILSIAFDVRVPILEANSERLLARLVGFRDDPAKAAGQRYLWHVAEQLLPRMKTGAFNQALMEVGSQVCTARRPECPRCPVAAFCTARARNLQAAIPRPRIRPRLESVREAAVVVVRRDRVLLVKCADGQRWAGLWDFPRFRITSHRGAALAREMAAEVEKLTGVIVRPTRHMVTIRHGVTRFRITLECYAATYISGRRRQTGIGEIRWVRLHALEEYPLSATGRRLGRLAIGTLAAGQPEALP